MALPNNKVRQYHVVELKALYNTGGALNASNSYEAYDQYTDRSNAITEINSLLDSSSLTDPELTTLKSDIAAAITSNIGSAINVNMTTVLTQIESDYNALVDAELADPKVCPECQGNGVHPTYNGNGSPTGNTIESALCNGWGKTDGQYILNPSARQYIPQS